MDEQLTSRLGEGARVLEPASFDAVAAFYSFNHVPRDVLATLFTRIHAWLRPRRIELLCDAGFEIVLDELVTFLERDREVTFQWVLAQR